MIDEYIDTVERLYFKTSHPLGFEHKIFFDDWVFYGDKDTIAKEECKEGIQCIIDTIYDDKYGTFKFDDWKISLDHVLSCVSTICSGIPIWFLYNVFKDEYDEMYGVYIVNFCDNKVPFLKLDLNNEIYDHIEGMLVYVEKLNTEFSIDHIGDLFADAFQENITKYGEECIYKDMQDVFQLYLLKIDNYRTGISKHAYFFEEGAYVSDYVDRPMFSVFVQTYRIKGIINTILLWCQKLLAKLHGYDYVISIAELNNSNIKLLR